MSRLEPALASVRNMWRPIPDAALPDLTDQVSGIATTSLLAILLVAPGGPGFLAAAVLAGCADPLRAQIVASSFSLLFILNNVWARSEHGRRHPNGVLLLTAAGIALGAASMGWTCGAQAESLISVIVVLPALIAMFVPWKPVYALCSAALALLSMSAGLSVIAAELVWPPAMMIGVALAIGVVSAVAQQLTRSLWLRLEGTKEQLLAADRMSTLGRMTAGIAHELKTPLASIHNTVEIAKSLGDELERSIGHDRVTDDDLREIAREIAGALVDLGTSAQRATSFIQAIRHHGSSGGPRGSRLPFSVEERVTAVVGLLSFRIRNSQLRVEAEALDEHALVFGDPGKFDQVITNLISNALDACEESGAGTSIKLRGRVTDGRVVLTLEDDGPGVPAAISDRIFEPLFTTRAEGTGLGLPISRDLMQAEFGGDLALVPSLRGARFELSCPAASG